MTPFGRGIGAAASLLAALALTLSATGPAEARKPRKARPAAAAPAPQTPWLYRGSDIPPDPAWRFGELPNGLRYALRNNGAPPRQVSIRVAIDAGSLAENANERGFAHLIEHLSFRGSRHVADGEAIRIWQRLGATFGSDTNATTSPTQTIYKLDLPSATPGTVDRSLEILAGMMAAPTMTASEVETEKLTVMAEARERDGPAARASDLVSAFFYAGQKLADAAPIGKPEALAKATPESLRAFHDRWYRPEHTLIVISGDLDPAIFESSIKKYFADWRGKGRLTLLPPFGDPTPRAPTARVEVVRGMPLNLNIAWIRPWRFNNDTVAFNRARLIDQFAVRLINRRLEEAARAGGSFLEASADLQDVARSANATFVQAVPLGDDWEAALADVRQTIADALANPPTQAEIDREASEFFSGLQQQLETERAESSPTQADDVVAAVNIRETVASAQVAIDVFGGVRPELTPARLLEATRRVFAGIGPRTFLMMPAPSPDATARLESAMAKPVVARTANAANQAPPPALPDLGKPGRVVRSGPVPGLPMDSIQFANGVRMTLFSNTGETGRIYVSVRFGQGRKAMPAGKGSLLWTSSALAASGIEGIDQNGLDRFASGRKIALSFAVGDDAFEWGAQTRAVDLPDQLKLIAAKLVRPGWNAAPVVRLRAAYLTGLSGTNASPQDVLGRELPGFLAGGDPRWRAPTQAEIEALTPDAFRKFWQRVLRAGPVDVMVAGDIDRKAAIEAVAASLGAMPRRGGSASAAGKPPPAPLSSGQPVRFTHEGGTDQAAAVLGWPTGGGAADIFEARKLEILADVFSDRLFARLREAARESYSPSASSSWPVGMSAGGRFIVTGQTRPEETGLFFKIAEEIAADLMKTPVTPDELARVQGPLREFIARASSGNMFWMRQMSGAARDPRRIAAVNSLGSDYARVNPSDLQAAAQRWLVPSQAFRLVVVPEQESGAEKPAR